MKMGGAVLETRHTANSRPRKSGKSGAKNPVRDKVAAFLL
jgi:hypothetical protein